MLYFEACRGDFSNIRGNLWLAHGIDPDEFHRLDIGIHFLLYPISAFYRRHNLPCVITSIIRPDGIHKTGRAVDIRTRTMVPELVKLLAHRINELFPYGCALQDPSRYPDTFLWHQNRRDGKPDGQDIPDNRHGHLQVKGDDGQFERWGMAAWFRV